jgi:hypothetical protein
MTTTTTPIRTEQRATILRQISRMDRLATDGGRPAIALERGVRLTCGSGYRVDVILEPNDTYTVRRVYVRGAREWVKGERTEVYWPELSETVYRAGCFRDEWT